MQRYIPAEGRIGLVLIAALTLLLLCGFVGLAVDVGLRYRTSRALQHAADAAALAASRDGGISYQQTGKAAAARYGFVDGKGGVTVRVLNNQRCSDGEDGCYKATIDDPSAPQYFSRMIGIPVPPLSVSATLR